MKGYMRVIRPDGTTETTTCDGRVPSLQEIYAALECQYMEKVPGWDTLLGDEKQRCVVYIDEGAKGAYGGPLKPVNDPATLEWERVAKRAGLLAPETRLSARDYIAGNAVVLWGDREWMAEL